MHHSKLLTTVILAIQFSAVQVVAQTCESYCTNYDQTLVNCRSLYSAGVVGTGPISADAVGCMCVGTETVTGYYVLSECYQCYLLTGGDSDLGPQVAEQCWNQNLLNGNTGKPCAQGSAHPSASGAAATSSSVEIVVSSAAFSFSSVATASASTGVLVPAATTTGAPTTAASTPITTATKNSSANSVYASWVTVLIGVVVLFVMIQFNSPSGA